MSFASVTNEEYGPIIAHYWCEKAEKHGTEGELSEALALLNKALSADAQCVRANMLQGDMHLASGNLKAAQAAYLAIEYQNPVYLSEIISSLCQCFPSPHEKAHLKKHLMRILKHFGGATVTSAVANMLLEEEGHQKAYAFITEQLHQRPTIRGITYLLELEEPETEVVKSGKAVILKKAIDALREHQSIYQCRQCGFPGRLLHWQCPGCRYWGTVFPVQGVEGE